MVMDSINCVDNKRNNNQEFIFLANSYLNKNNPICREERQYSLFLNNSLKREDADIMKSLNLKGSIVDVFFESTLMRDYWHDNKIIFNSLLNDYIKNKFNCSCEIGLKKSYHINFWKKSHPYGVSMMNAKPDIAVINHVDNNYFLNLIECKYKSKIDIYKYNGFSSLTQIEVQEYILEFLCEYLNLKKRDSLGNDAIIQKGRVIKVKFNLSETSSGTIDSSGFNLINIKEIM